MMAAPGLECPYEASDEASESELLDRSLSVWRGRLSVDGSDEFAPIPLDLHTASSIGQYDCVRNIIQRGDVDLNAKNRGGWTALMYAAYIGHDNVVNLLLESRVDVNTANNKGHTPLMLAAGSCGNESIAYFLLQHGAELEARDKKGWTALFHATYSGHQNMVKFLLLNKADTEAREPTEDRTPFMVAAAEGHEIIVQYFLQHQAVNVNAKGRSGDTARSLAFFWGHKKIVSLIDNHVRELMSAPRTDPGIWHPDDLSSSDEAVNRPRRHGNTKPNRKTSRGPNIRDGPEAFAKLVNSDVPSAPDTNPSSCIPKGYVTFKSDNVSPPETSQIRSRDVTSPIDPDDHTGSLDSSSGGREFNEYEDDTNAFSKTGALTIKSSSSSSGGLVAAFGISQHSSTDDDALLDDQSVRSDPGQRSQPPKVVDPGQGHTSPELKAKKKSPAKVWSEPADNTGQRPPVVHPQPHKATARVNPFPPPANPVRPALHPPAPSPYHAPPSPAALPGWENGRVPPVSAPDVAYVPGVSTPKPQPHDLPTLLKEIGLTKYLMVFEEQDVDLQVFLSLTDNDLKEIGIKLFGPRRKLTNTIARWHSNAPPSGQSLEQAYADKLEAEMQEMAIQLHQAYDQSEHLKAQVLQERELRSVTEGCLIKMEDRSSRQHVLRLAADTLQCCSETQEGIKRAKLYTEELSRRRLPQDHDPALEPDSLVKAIHQGLSLDEGPAAPEDLRDLSRVSAPTLVQRLAGAHEDVWRAVSIATHNVEKLLGRNTGYGGSVHDGFS